ncbi:MAG: thioredoxin family protein [Anaerolineae bacterium]|nr:thioredoxin family protein [Thermoflexales bacterium]MDW8396727.1 thioredoxin family protein [Anaerolineae bacterium]
MSLLDDRTRQEVQKALTAMTEPVKLVLFTQGEFGSLECEYCRETRQLAEEVAALSDKLTLEVRYFSKDIEAAQALGVDKIPAIAVLRDGKAPHDFGVRLFGIPSGYEFGTFVQSILLVSHAKHDLSPHTLEQLAQLKQPVHIQVFVTPTCPYCPRAVLLAFRLAVASPLVRADMVEAIEFPHLSSRYQVHGVPRTVINEVIHIEGAVPEGLLMEELMQVNDEAQMQRLRELHRST